MFIWRLLCLTVLLTLIAWWDYRRLGPTARRWQEYLFLYSAGACAALLGALNDLYTVSVSPDYFISGKGLEAGDGLMLRAMGLGAQAGFVAGVVIAGCLLLRFRRETWRTLVQFIAWISGGAIGIAWLSQLILPRFLSSLDYVSQMPWSDQQKEDFIFVWSIHIGLYIGALLMLLVIVIGVKSQRQPLREAG